MLTNGMIQNSNNENQDDYDGMCFHMSKRRKRLTMMSCKPTDLNQVQHWTFLEKKLYPHFEYNNWSAQQMHFLITS